MTRRSVSLPHQVSLQTFLEWFTQGAIVLLAILMLVQWLRWRDRVVARHRPRLRLPRSAAGPRAHACASRTSSPPGSRRSASRVLVAHPYLLLRVVSHFRPVSRVLRAHRSSWLWRCRCGDMGAGEAVRHGSDGALRSCISSGCSGTWPVRSRRGAQGGRRRHALAHAACSWGALLLRLVFVLAVRQFQPVPDRAARLSRSSFRDRRWAPR